ncbi:hypothetical protein VIGAN_08130700, partial [Vigna angularis var. angularis]
FSNSSKYYNSLIQSKSAKQTYRKVAFSLNLTGISVCTQIHSNVWGYPVSLNHDMLTTTLNFEKTLSDTAQLFGFI